MATSGFSSTLSLAMVTLPLCSSAISSSTGEIILHGPHHSAQKSTSTGVLDWSTWLSNVASVTAAALVIPPVPPRTVIPGLVQRRRATTYSLPADGAVKSLPVVGGGRGVVAVGLQPALGVDGGRAARARRGHRLPVDVVDHVAGGEHPVHAGGGRWWSGGDDVAGLVELELPAEQLGVRGVPDGDEHPGDRQDRLRAVLEVAQAHPVHRLLAEHVVDHRVPGELDLGVGEGAVLHDLGGAQ